MGLYIGDTYWTYDDGTASIVSDGKINRIKTQWPNGVRNNFTALFTTGYRQRTPESTFVLSVYKYNKWHVISQHKPNVYQDWVRWSNWIEGYYNRWFKVEFGGESRLFSVGLITNQDFIPWPAEDIEEEKPLWDRALEEVKSVIADLVVSFRTESIRVDKRIDTFKKTLADSRDKAATDTEKLINESGDGLYLRFKKLLDSYLDRINKRVMEAFEAIENINSNVVDIYTRINEITSLIDSVVERIKAAAVEAVISYVLYIIDIILDSEIEDLEDKEDGRDIYRHSERTS